MIFYVCTVTCIDFLLYVIVNVFVVSTEIPRRTEPMGGSGRSTDRFGLTTGDPGFRTVTPNILPTQHNRTLTTGLV